MDDKLEPLISLLESYTEEEINAVFLFLKEFKRTREVDIKHRPKDTHKSIIPILRKRLDATIPSEGESVEQRKVRAAVIYEQIIETL